MEIELIPLVDVIFVCVFILRVYFSIFIFNMCIVVVVLGRLAWRD